MNRSLGTAVIFLLAGACAAPALASDDRFTLLGDLPGSWDASFANAVSGDGAVVVGGSWGADGYEAFKWTEGVGMVGLGELPGGIFYSTGTGVSDDGSVVVGFTEIGNNHSRAVRWIDDAGPAQLVLCKNCPEQACDTTAYGLTADGQTAVGLCGFIPTGDFQAVRWDGADGVTEMGELVAHVISADGSVIAGRSPTRVGWIWREGEPEPTSIGELTPGGHSEPWGISEDGNTAVGHAGIFIDGVYTEVPFIWTRDGGMRQIEPPGGRVWGNAWGMTADGTIAIGTTPCPECPGAFSAWIWDPENGARLLDEVAQSDYGIDLGGMHIDQAMEISPDGQWIVGSAHADQQGTFDLAVRIRLVGGCKADLDHSGVLDLFDFLTFVNLFNAKDPGADCDGNGSLNFFDFLCFTNLFNAGC